jgi:ABC-type antimicrobial peptide transport system permease subunit
VTAAGLDIATQTFGMRQIYMEQAVSCVFMDFSAVERHFKTREAFMMQLRLEGVPDEAGDARLSDAIADAVPGAVFTSGRAIRGLVDEVGGTVLAVTAAVAFAALCLAAFGVGSVVAAGIDARRREFGVLRAVGGSTRTVVSLVLAETTVMALAALVSGTGLGLQLAWMGVSLYRDFAGLELAWVVPTAGIALGGAVVVAFALVAATPAVIRLARRPARELLASG